MKLALFFTKSMSLEMWLSTGLFDREKIIYEQHLSSGFFRSVYWFTYGSNDEVVAEELKEQNRLHPDIHVVPLPSIFKSKIGRILYSFIMPFLHRSVLKSVDILKTNQMDGSWAALIAKFLYGKKLVVRTGYVLSIHTRNKRLSRLRRMFFWLAEYLAFHFSDIGFVSSNSAKEYICSKYKVGSTKVAVVPNYIDTSLFKPSDKQKYDNRLVYVGRLTHQKNLYNLFDAVAATDFELDVYGQGEQFDELQSYVRNNSIKINFMGVVPNKELPGVLCKYRYYILPSLYEGMPKTLLEAMACGLICIGTNVEGTREVINDGVNGILAQSTSSNSILESLNRLKGIGDVVGSNAVDTIKEGYSLNSIMKLEEKYFNQVCEL